jgi:hypothetical protein
VAPERRSTVAHSSARRSSASKQQTARRRRYPETTPNIAATRVIDRRISGHLEGCHVLTALTIASASSVAASASPREHDGRRPHRTRGTERSLKVCTRPHVSAFAALPRACSLRVASRASCSTSESPTVEPHPVDSLEAAGAVRCANNGAPTATAPAPHPDVPTAHHPLDRSSPTRARHVRGDRAGSGTMRHPADHWWVAGRASSIRAVR